MSDPPNTAARLLHLGSQVKFLRRVALRNLLVSGAPVEEDVRPAMRTGLEEASASKEGHHNMLLRQAGQTACGSKPVHMLLLSKFRVQG